KPDRALIALAHLQVPDPDPCFFRPTDQTFQQHLPDASSSAVLPDTYIGNLPLVQAQDDPAVSQDFSVFLRDQKQRILPDQKGEKTICRPRSGKICLFDGQYLIQIRDFHRRRSEEHTSEL